MSDNLGAFDTKAANATLNERNKLMLAQNMIRTTESLKVKYEKLLMGKSKLENHLIRDPSRPNSFIKLTMHMVDGALQTVWTVNDHKVWEECALQRQKEAQDKKAGLVYTGFGMQWFLTTFLLELYILLKYGIDLRSTQWLKPDTEDGKKMAWIMDHDQFAMRYKTTNMMESRNARDPFAKLH